jgi:hypothetical protein
VLTGSITAKDWRLYSAANSQIISLVEIEMGCGERMMHMAGPNHYASCEDYMCTTTIDMPNTRMIIETNSWVEGSTIDIDVDILNNNGRISASGQGYAAGEGPSPGQNFTETPEKMIACPSGRRMPGSGGGGTGGDGARTTTRQAGCQDWNQGGKGGYGSATEPWSFGSGGGNGAYDGNIETYYGGAGTLTLLFDDRVEIELPFLT